MLIVVSCTDQAWTNLKELPDHKHRRSDIALSNGRFVLVPHGTTAKGLSTYLTNFLIAQPGTNSQYYNTEPPYFLNPQYFVDCRQYAQQQYEDFGYPSAPRLAVAGAQIWTDLSVGAARHHISIPHGISVLNAASSIASYWHLSFTILRPPRSQQEQLSALLNALGLGLLYHPLLPKGWPDNPLTEAEGRISPKVALELNKLPDQIPTPPAPYVYVPEHQLSIRKRQATKALPSICEGCQQKPPAYKYTRGSITHVYCSDCADGIKTNEEMLQQSEQEYQRKLKQFEIGNPSIPFRPVNPWPRPIDLTNYKLEPLANMPGSSYCTCTPPRPATHKYTIYPEKIDVYVCLTCLPKLTANLHPNQYSVVELTRSGS